MMAGELLLIGDRKKRDILFSGRTVTRAERGGGGEISTKRHSHWLEEGADYSFREQKAHSKRKSAQL